MPPITRLLWSLLMAVVFVSMLVEFVRESHMSPVCVIHAVFVAHHDSMVAACCLRQEQGYCRRREAGGQGSPRSHNSVLDLSWQHAVPSQEYSFFSALMLLVGQQPLPYGGDTHAVPSNSVLDRGPSHPAERGDFSGTLSSCSALMLWLG